MFNCHEPSLDFAGIVGPGHRNMAIKQVLLTNTLPAHEKGSLLTKLFPKNKLQGKVKPPEECV